jgi:ATP-dependent RNA helicase DDX5/DBP2
MKKILIFGLYKKNVDQLETLMLNDRELNAAVNYEAWALTGNKSQATRDQVYARFKIPTKDYMISKGGKQVNACNIMIATDVASRGLDVKDVDIVINYEMPLTFDDYVHRIGRTGRAGSKGLSVSFIEPEAEGFLVHDLMNFITKAG